jgi:alanyl-tRNA synthetase
VVLAGVVEGKVAIVVATDKSINAQDVVKELAALVGGGGGGSTSLALAGGRDPDGIDRVLAAAARL